MPENIRQKIDITIYQGGPHIGELHLGDYII